MGARTESRRQQLIEILLEVIVEETNSIGFSLSLHAFRNVKRIKVCRGIFKLWQSTNHPVASLHFLLNWRWKLILLAQQ